MRSVRWGMIGAGSVAEVKSGPAFQLAARSSLVAVMRRTPGRAGDYARRHGVARHYEDAAALIQDPGVDAVYVATPPGSHKELALLACRHGKPVYLEKPMARNHAECTEINAAFAARGLPVFVAYYRRRLPRFVTLKERLDAGELGKIRAIDYRYARPPIDLPGELPWRLRAEHSGGGLFLDVGCHALDLIDHLFGPIQVETASATNRSPLYDVEDRISLRFRTSAGAGGSGEWDFRAPAREDSLAITGSRGHLQLPVFGDQGTVQLPLIQSIVDELCGEGASPSTGRTAARTSRVIDEVLDAYYGGRGDAFWERPGTWPGAQARLRPSA